MFNSTAQAGHGSVRHIALEKSHTQHKLKRVAFLPTSLQLKTSPEAQSRHSYQRKYTFRSQSATPISNMSGIEIIGILANIAPLVSQLAGNIEHFVQWDRRTTRQQELLSSVTAELDIIIAILPDYPTVDSDAELLAILTESIALAKALHGKMAKAGSRPRPPIWLFFMARWLGKREKREIDALISQLIDARMRLIVTISEGSVGESITRQDKINQVQASPQYLELDAHGKAVLDTLLLQYRQSISSEEAARYFAAGGRFINGLQSPAAETKTVRDVGEALLEVLRYKVMESRRDDIAKEFQSSCKWVFEDNPPGSRWTSLPDWLANGSGVYLIEGHEASGKSTMMKYIFTNDQTHTHLQTWAGPDSLVATAFFFWRNGTRLEKSDEGLFRSLLYSVLSQEPQLIPTVLPREWAMLYSSATIPNVPNAGLGAWRVKDLQEAFRRLVNQRQVALKMFFLVDGIDEYQQSETDNDYASLLDFFKNEMAASPNAKLLFSSRPLGEFGQLNIEPNLTLHELNHDDIESYVRTVLDDNTAFRDARTADTQSANNVTNHIVEKSSGIFLWAVLSVEAIKGKLSGGATLHEISQDLDTQLGPALHDLYHRILASLEVSSRLQASEVLQIVLATPEVRRSSADDAEESLRLIDLAMALGDPQDTVEASIRPWEQDRVNAKCDKIAKAFMRTWPGFITTANPSESRGNVSPASVIRYCHRSVPEFLRRLRPDLVETSKTGPYSFCPYLGHLKSAVHQLKIMPNPLPDNSRRSLWAFATSGLLAASRVDASDSAQESSYRELLRALDQAMQHHHKRLQKGPDNRYIATRLQDPNGVVALDDKGRDAKRIAKMHWSNFHFDPNCSHPRSWEDSFLSLAIQFGLQTYVTSQLGPGVKVSKSKKGRPLLDYALRPSPLAPYDLIQPKLVETLLDRGSNPNDKFGDRTCWEGALLWQYETFLKGSAKAITETGGTTNDARIVAGNRAAIFRLLIDKGANLDAIISVSEKYYDTLPAKTVVEESFKAWVEDDTYEGLLTRFKG
ncbi:hypothetical protein MKZ38_004471 [Zalerion maritima]|uniref:Nephrocystin 3-like N-terminal domain-containing protein n=1 Tax=Zalerion maritima TaxID=339359 RepID=A0AAD5RLX6_9PEZI|nr:hypothetical protein MKZ38_004471 [Zalerion maritima]